MAVLDYAVVALLAGGAFFGLVATIGLLRLPDFYTRTHAASKGETLSAILTLAAVALAIGEGLPAVKVVLLLVFAFLTNPTAAHAISRAAYEEDVRPWTTDDGGPDVEGGAD
jgi:multicomponent Na+:H+ antiporter subunit G